MKIPHCRKNSRQNRYTNTHMHDYWSSWPDTNIPKSMWYYIIESNVSSLCDDAVNNVPSTSNFKIINILV